MIVRVYYLNAEYSPGKHKIVSVWASGLGSQRPEDSPATVPNSPYSVLEIDEDWNRPLVQGLLRSTQVELGLIDKFYIDNGAPPQIRRVDNNAVVPITANPNKADWVASVLAGATDAQIDTWFTNNVTTLVQARTVMAMMAKLIARLARQAGFE